MTSKLFRSLLAPVWMGLALSVAALSGCGTSAGTCDYTNCTGCCDSNGQCQSGLLPTACGERGGACTTCSGNQACQLGFCVSNNNGGGGGGGGGDGGVETDAGFLTGEDGGTDGGTGCTAPLVACGGACVDTQTNPNHCGTCGRSCGAGGACENSQCKTLPTDCTITPCPTLGYYCDLASKQCKVGCVSNANCSGVLSKCDVATRSCVCQFGSCGATSYCTAAGTCASGCEANNQCSGEQNTCNTQTHACACGPNSCPTGKFCATDGSCKTGCGLNSQCTAQNENTCNTQTNQCECNTGFHRCSGACVDNKDLNSCGTTSCTPCPAAPAHATATCDGTQCGFACDSGYFRNGDKCYPMQTRSRTHNLGSETSCSIGSSGTVSCTGRYSQAAAGNGAYLVSDYDSFCLLTSTGAVYCAGDGSRGQLGQGNYQDSNTFVSVPNLPADVVRLAMGEDRVFALTSTGDVYRWGTGWQVRDGNDPNPWAVKPALTPEKFKSGAKDIGTLEDYLCLVVADGSRILCYGGYSGSGGSYSTKAISAPAGVVLERVSWGDAHGCAVDSAGLVYCWGHGGGGKLGYTSTSTNAPLTKVPGFPPAGSKAIAVGTNSYHSCAVLDNGELYCWGLITSSGGSSTPSPAPRKVGSSGMVNVTGNWSYICPSGGSTSCFKP